MVPEALAAFGVEVPDFEPAVGRAEAGLFPVRAAPVFGVPVAGLGGMVFAFVYYAPHVLQGRVGGRVVWKNGQNIFFYS